MKRRTGYLILAGLALGLSGCASVIELRLPEAYRDKKTVEDPPSYQQGDEKGILDKQK